MNTPQGLEADVLSLIVYNKFSLTPLMYKVPSNYGIILHQVIFQDKINNEILIIKHSRLVFRLSVCLFFYKIIFNFEFG